MISENLRKRIEGLSQENLVLIKVLIFNYNNLNQSDEIKKGYRYALYHIFHILDIASFPDIDIRPAVEQQIDKIVKSIIEIENIS